MRYPAWFGKRGDAGQTQAIEVGKKLLGYLSVRRQTPGVETLAARRTLDDGTVVDASFHGDLPVVRVIPGGEQVACELYVESGLLDLGLNVSPTAAERFNPGLPEFDDEPAVIHFGDGVDCPPGRQGLNGAIQIGTTGGLRSQCIARGGDPINSRLRDPVKKQAQALLPASTWSGLMQRYVAAVYGGTALDYSATPTTLTIAGTDFPVTASVGIVDVGGRLLFAVIDGTLLQYRALVPSSECFRYAMDLWHGMPSATETERDRRTKVLSIALSGFVMGDVVAEGEIAAAGNRHFTHRAAWQFSPTGLEAVAVLEQGGVATAHLATFDLSGDTAIASLEELASGDVLNTAQWPLLAHDKSPYDNPAQHTSELSGSASSFDADDEYDFPVYGYFDHTGAVRLVRCTAIAAGSPIAVTSECFGFGNGGLDGPVIVGTDVERKCRSDVSSYYDVAYGYYSDGWSTVQGILCMGAIGNSSRIVRVQGAGFHAVASDMTLRTFSESYSGPLTTSVPDFYPGDPGRSGTVSGGDGGCQLRNVHSNAGTLVFQDLGYDIPCVRLLDGVSDYSDQYAFEGTWEYVNASGYVLSGQLSLAGIQVLSLAWGATDCFVIEDYSFKGGSGGFASFLGAYTPANYLDFGGMTAGAGRKLSATLTIDATFNTRVYSIPGDCGSTIESGPQVALTVIADSTGGANAGPLAVPLRTFAEMETSGLSFSIQYKARTHYTSPASSQISVLRHIETAYPAPLHRGIEKYRAWLNFATVADDLVEEREVDTSYDGDEYSHEDGVGVFNYEPDDLIDCDTAPLFGFATLSNDAIVESLSDEADAKWVSRDKVNTSWLTSGYSYSAAHSLLGAKVRPVLGLDRGVSIHMDRSAVTGGYPTVNTPSFVGWA